MCELFCVSFHGTTPEKMLQYRKFNGGHTMSAISIQHFDALSYVKHSKELGVSEQVAEYQAREIEKAIDIAITTVKEYIQAKDLATKKDLELAKNQIIIWVAGLFIASGLVQHFFK